MLRMKRLRLMVLTASGILYATCIPSVFVAVNKPPNQFAIKCVLSDAIEPTFLVLFSCHVSKSINIKCGKHSVQVFFLDELHSSWYPRIKISVEAYQ